MASANWRQRNSTPYEICDAVAIEHRISMDWLILGTGQGTRGEDGAAITVPRGPEAGRLARSDEFWETTRSPAEMTWLEQTVRRAVPECGDWQGSQLPG